MSGALTVVNPLPISDVERVALAIAKGGLFGSSDPNAVLTLCLLAQAEGQHPAVVFRDYHIIKGKPAKKADAMLRDFVQAGGKVEWHKLDDTTADATFSHAGGGTARIDWTMDRARTAGLTTDMWRKYPRQMLRSRVISEGVRTVYPGATSGLYEVGEMQDITANDPEPKPVVIDQPANETVGEFTEVDPKPRKREKLDGPYTSLSALKTAYHQLDRDIRACETVDELELHLAKETTVALMDQLRRDAKGYMVGADNLPPETVPIMQLISQHRTFLQSLDDGSDGSEPHVWSGG